MVVFSKMYDVAHHIYETGGASAVYNWANEHDIPYGLCNQCEVETPNIGGVCAICGHTSPPQKV